MTDGAHKAICPHPVPIHPFCCNQQGLVSPRIQVKLFSFFLLKGEVNEVRTVPENHADTRMTHLMWMGAKHSWQAEALTLVTSKANEFHLPMSGQAPSKREKASLPRLPFKALPSCALTWNLFGRCFSGAFQLRGPHHFTPSAGLCFPKARNREHLLWTLLISETIVIPKNSPN